LKTSRKAALKAKIFGKVAALRDVTEGTTVSMATADAQSVVVDDLVRPKRAARFASYMAVLVATNNFNMPSSCLGGGYRSVSTNGVSLHKFPSERKLGKAWTKFVQFTRHDFQQLSSHSCVWSLHLTSDCNERNMVAESLGFSRR